MDDGTAVVSGRAALAHRDFNLYQLARFFLVLAIQMQSVAIGWQVYALTHRPLDLGLVGLAQFLPSIGFSLVTGHAADRFDRRRLLATCYSAIALSSALLFGLSMLPRVPVAGLYATLVVLGTARAFAGPASQAMVPNLVPAEHFPNAVTWNATVFQIATIVGPAAGGLVYGATHGPSAVYASSFAIGAVGTLCVLWIRARSVKGAVIDTSWASLLAGIRYVWRQKLILGTISLDLFAVLLGGAVALLPVYARDLLHVGPWGLGFLRSAPALGAATMAIALAYRPLHRHAGAIMLWCVALFGVATIVFGLSRSFPLSLIALTVAGASDMVSVVVRLTLVQIATPDSMRGRVSAVNMVFIGASNELGEFESGVTAAWLGTVPAVVLGGVGTCLVVALWAWRFPELRRINRVEDAAVREGGSST